MNFIPFLMEIVILVLLVLKMIGQNLSLSHLLLIDVTHKRWLFMVITLKVKVPLVKLVVY
jgi:hypothetical protein